MRFVLLDRIVDFEKGKRLKGTKSLSLAEEYLKDHFPKHPIMPGVLMLESLIQAGGWLLRLTRNFEVGAVLLKEAKNVRFAKFVAPGDLLSVEVTWQKEEGELVEISGKGSVGDETVIAAKLALRPIVLGEIDPRLKAQEEVLRAHYRSLFSQIYQPAEARV